MALLLHLDEGPFRSLETIVFLWILYLDIDSSLSSTSTVFLTVVLLLIVFSNGRPPMQMFHFEKGCKNKMEIAKLKIQE